MEITKISSWNDWTKLVKDIKNNPKKYEGYTFGINAETVMSEKDFKKQLKIK